MIRAAATLAIAVVITGCSPGVDSYSIHRFSVPDDTFPPLDRTVTDAGIASRLYEDLRALRHGSCHLIDLGAGDVRAFDDRFEADLLGALGFYTRGNDLWPTPIPRP